MYGDWALPGRPTSYIALLDLAIKHLPEKQAALIHFSEICAKPGDWYGGDDFSGPDMKPQIQIIPACLFAACPIPVKETIEW
jgi:hypothetical protein